MDYINAQIDAGFPIFPSEILNEIFDYANEIRLILAFKSYIFDNTIIRIFDTHYNFSILDITSLSLIEVFKGICKKSICKTSYDIRRAQRIIEIMFSLNYKVPWYNPEFHMILTESFMIHYEFIFNMLNKDDWKYICGHQKLTEFTMRHFIDKLDWTGESLLDDRYSGFRSIYHTQKLSLEFIEEFKDRIMISNNTGLIRLPLEMHNSLEMITLTNGPEFTLTSLIGFITNLGI